MTTNTEVCNYISEFGSHNGNKEMYHKQTNKHKQMKQTQTNEGNMPSYFRCLTNALVE